MVSQYIISARVKTKQKKMRDHLKTQHRLSPLDVISNTIPSIVVIDADDDHHDAASSNVPTNFGAAKSEFQKSSCNYNNVMKNHQNTDVDLSPSTAGNYQPRIHKFSISGLALTPRHDSLQQLRKSNSLTTLHNDSHHNGSRPALLKVMSITASDSVSFVDDDDDDDRASDIANNNDLDDDVLQHDGDERYGSSQSIKSAKDEEKITTNGHDASSESTYRTPWTRTIKASWTAKNTFNPIRAIVDKMTVKPNPSKPVISLSIGDPTFYGNMMPADATIDAVREALDSGKFHGYLPAAGMNPAREAVARHLNAWFDPPSGGSTLHALQGDDVYLTHGCSHALELCLTVLCDSGKSNVLLPRPGFPIYTTLSMSRNVECRQYRLLPQQNFEADLEHLDALVDDNTAAIVVTNPANPCGSVYSRQHLLDIVAIARKHQVPIIADEIYCDFVFNSSRFIPIGSLSEDVPVLSAGGLTKKYIVPGWRLGWVVIYDRDKLFDAQIRDGINALCQRILGPCSLIQGALPAILARPPMHHVSSMIAICETNAKVAFEAISAMPGLCALMPQGAMYMMVEIYVDQFDGAFGNDVEFSWQLMSEQSVYCLPGSIFGSDNFIRLVLTLPDDKMQEAMKRMLEFCTTHFVGEMTPHVSYAHLSNGNLVNGETNGVHG